MTKDGRSSAQKGERERDRQTEREGAKKIGEVKETSRQRQTDRWKAWAVESGQRSTKHDEPITML